MRKHTGFALGLLCLLSLTLSACSSNNYSNDLAADPDSLASLTIWMGNMSYVETTFYPDGQGQLYHYSGGDISATTTFNFDSAKFSEVADLIAQDHLLQRSAPRVDLGRFAPQRYYYRITLIAADQRQISYYSPGDFCFDGRFYDYPLGDFTSITCKIIGLLH
jgi:hypothetical protein